MDATVTTSNTHIASFTYDGDGRRVIATEAGTTTVFIGNHFEWKNSAMTKYYYAGGMRLAVRNGNTSGTSQLSFLLSDHLGSTRLTYRADLATSELASYTAWGVASGAFTNTRYTYTGQYSYAASFGLMYYNARWYDPTLNRFAQADSIVPNPGNPMSWDRYAYVLNNPLKYRDPSGHNEDCGMGDSSCKVSYSQRDYDRRDRIGDSYSARLQRSEKRTPITKQHQETRFTLTEQVMKGDVSALIELLTPSHIGGRLQLEISLDIGIGLSGSVGVNGVYNQHSDELAANVDWALEPGGGVGFGASATGGLLVGWGSSSVNDVTQGYSAIISGTAAAESALAVAISAPLDDTGLHVDPYSGQVPTTLYVGGGAGGAYAGFGGGINGPTGIHFSLTPFLPWR